MIAFLNILWLLLGALPLIFTLFKMSKTGKTKSIKNLRLPVIIAGLDIILLILINIFFYFYAEMLWYESLSYLSRFMTANITIFFLFTAGWVIAFLFLFLCIRPVFKNTFQRIRRISYLLGTIVVGLFFGLAASNMWELYLQFIHQAPSVNFDPLWGIPVGFYLFSLPFFYEAAQWITWLIVIGLGLQIFLHLISESLLSAGAVQGGTITQGKVFEHLKRIKRPAMSLVSMFLLCLALFTIFDIYSLMFGESGVVSGIGYVDSNIRVFAMICTTVAYILAALFIVILQIAPKLGTRFTLTKINNEGRRAISKVPALITGSVILIVFLLNAAVPEIVTSLILKPNEITLERPFIKHSIASTRNAFNIGDDTIKSSILPINPVITKEILEKNKETLDNIRLWDWNALKDNLKEQQEIRSYYAFHDVDIDRYKINGEYLQVMLSVREMEKSNLDSNSKTWVSRHLKYTHGYGLVLIPVHEIMPQGKPKLLIKNIPPQSEVDITITRPEIYFGERTTDHVYVNTTEEEFDYPEGENNVYTQYEGEGGVPLDNFLKRIALAWKFDGQDQLLSSYLTSETRIMFRRHIVTRAATIAPFLSFDDDPYAIITDDGRIVYMLDAYFISGNYPYAQKYYGPQAAFQGLNYIRNSVKVIVDAYSGAVDFYITDKTDIMAQTYQNIYPGLFKSIDEMPSDLKAHIRYPETLFTIQAEMYQTFHMEDPDVFYQREDKWAFAIERYRSGFVDITPYYVMVQFPGNDHAEFILMVPFTPKGKNIINAWMAARCDFPNYGQLIVYRFPKGIEVVGPRQIEARIDQDPEMSEAMTLWGQGGSEVIRGNTLAIPLFDDESVSLFYVEPIFLQASDAKLPELRRIVLADQNNIVWNEAFEAALADLIEGRSLVSTSSTDDPGIVVAAVTEGTVPPDKDLLNEIAAAFTAYKKSLTEEDFAAAGKHLEKLNTLLKDIQ